MQQRMRSPLALLVLAAAVMALIISIAQAEPPQGAQGRHPGEMMQRMTRELGLTDQQKASIKAIMDEHRTKLDALMASNLPQDQKQAQRLELRKQMRAGILAVLTPEQRVKAEKMWEAGKELRKDFVECWQELNLTPDQKSSVKSIREQAAADAKAVWADKSLTDQQKHARIAEITEKARQGALALLTPAQKEQLKKCMAEDRKEVRKEMRSK